MVEPRGRRWREPPTKFPSPLPARLPPWRSGSPNSRQTRQNWLKRRWSPTQPALLTSRWRSRPTGNTASRRFRIGRRKRSSGIWSIHRLSATVGPTGMSSVRDLAAFIHVIACAHPYTSSASPQRRKQFASCKRVSERRIPGPMARDRQRSSISASELRRITALLARNACVIEPTTAARSSTARV
jgi:hypothetical protein